MQDELFVLASTLNVVGVLRRGPKALPVKQAQEIDFRWLEIVALAGVGLAASLCYVGDIYVSPMVTVPALTALGLLVLVCPPGHSRLAVLPRTMVGFYLLPFLHTWVYVFKPDGIFYPSFEASWTYQRDPIISSKLCLVGLIGLVGLVLGFLLVSPTSKNKVLNRNGARATCSLSLPAFILVLFVAIAFGRFYAFPATIFSARYSSLDPAAATVNFGGAGIVTFALLLVLLLDAWWMRPAGARRTTKTWLVLGGVLLVGVYFQLLRGDRDAVGFFLALAAFYVTHAGLRKSIKKGESRLSPSRVTATLLGVVGVFLASQTIGWWRTRAHAGVDLTRAWDAVIQTGLYFGTWTNALLTSMSAVGDLQRGLMDLRWGGTYLDLIASLPPGPLATLLDYTRPLDTAQNLAWQMRYGQGGYSVVVAPLVNFSAFGVLGMLTLEGALIAWIERKASRLNPMWVLLQLSVLAYGWGWFWYGELYAVRAVMVAFGTWVGYRALQKVDVSFRATLFWKKRFRNQG